MITVCVWIISYMVIGLVFTTPIPTAWFNAYAENMSDERSRVAFWHALFAAGWPVTVWWVIARLLTGRNRTYRLYLKEEEDKRQQALYERAKAELEEWSKTPEERARQKELDDLAAKFKLQRAIEKSERSTAMYTARYS